MESLFLAWNLWSDLPPRTSYVSLTAVPSVLSILLMLFCLLACFGSVSISPAACCTASWNPSWPLELLDFWHQVAFTGYLLFMSLTVISNRRMTEDIFIIIRRLSVIKRKTKLVPSLILSGMLVKGEILCWCLFLKVMAEIFTES